MSSVLFLHCFVVASAAANAALELLLAHKEAAAGAGTAALVRAAARACGRSERTIYRWLSAQAVPNSRKPALKLTDVERKLLAASNASVAAMSRRLAEQGAARGVTRTYQRAVRRDVEPAAMAFYRGGDSAWRQKTLHIPQVVEHRGQVFHVDHHQPKLWLSGPGRRRWGRIWVTVVICACTRRVMGFTVSEQPNEGIVLATLRQAFTGEYGCIPQRVIWDNGAEFLANGVTAALDHLGVSATPIAPYTPQQNGKIERFFGTLDREFTRLLPFYQRGPRGNNGRIYGPDDGPIRFEEFVEKVTEYVEHYNGKREHSMLGGLTPDEAWKRDVFPVRRLPEEQLEFLLLREKRTRVVRTYGIRWNNTYYTHDALLAYSGREASVRFMPHDARQIWVFDADDTKRICIAKPAEELDEHELARFFSTRSGQLSMLRSHLPGRSLHADDEPDTPSEEEAAAAFEKLLADGAVASTLVAQLVSAARTAAEGAAADRKPPADADAVPVTEPAADDDLNTPLQQEVEELQSADDDLNRPLD